MKNPEKTDDDRVILYVSLTDYISDKSDKSIKEYIKNQSRFPISDLPAQNITLLLDALDEAKEFRSRDEKESREFIKKFAEQIQALVKTGYRIVISSRYFPEEEFLPDFMRAKFLPLEDHQLQVYLRDDFETVRKSENLSNMLKNNFFLTIFKQIGLNAADVAKRDITAVELIELFFYRMYESKKQMNSDERKAFEEDMDFVAEMAFSEDILNRASAERGFWRQLIPLNCFLPIIAIRQQDDGRWEIAFSHMFFRDYFVARNVTNCIMALLSGEKKNDDDLQVLNQDYSYRKGYGKKILTMTSQMLRLKLPRCDELVNKIQFVFQLIEQIYKKRDKYERRLQIYKERDKYERRLWKIEDPDDSFIMPVNAFHRLLFRKDAAVPAFENFFIIIALYYEDMSKFDLNTEISEEEGRLGLVLPKFSEFEELRRIALPRGIFRIPEHTFFACENLIEVKIPEGVIDIGDSAFSGCVNLKEIWLPSSMRTIGSNAFKHCYALECIYYSGTKIQWFSLDKHPSYRYCASHFLIKCEDGDIEICEKFLPNGLEINQMDGKLTVVSVGWCSYRDIVIPNHIEAIGHCAFEYCKEICSVAFDVEQIGKGAFSGCRSLRTIKIGSRLKEVGEEAFFTFDRTIHRSVYYEGSLETWLGVMFHSNPCMGGACLYLSGKILNEAILDIPEIGPWSFKDCLSLEKIYLKRNVRKISEKAFYGCKNLSYIEFEGKISELSHIDFDSDWCGFTAVNSIICRDGIVPVEDPINNEATNLRYECNSDGTYSVSGVELEKSLNYYFHETMIIPQYFRGCLVTKILSSTFVNVNEISISDIYLPKSIQMIEVNDLKQWLYLHFLGTIEEWKRIKKEIPIVYDFKWCTLYCFDGELYGDEIFITN